MINTENAWRLIKNQGYKAMSTGMIYHSLVEKKEYKVVAVQEDKMTIARLSGGKNATLTKAVVEKAMEKFNSNGCKPMRRRTLIEKPVTSETTLVLFHPQLTWDKTGDHILAFIPE